MHVVLNREFRICPIIVSPKNEYGDNRLLHQCLVSRKWTWTHGDTAERRNDGPDDTKYYTGITEIMVILWTADLAWLDDWCFSSDTVTKHLV
jgi:hypothetical protein